MIRSEQSEVTITPVVVFNLSHRRQRHCGEKGKVRRSLKSEGFIFWGPWIIVQRIMLIPLKDDEIFRFGPNWSTN